MILPELERADPGSVSKLLKASLDIIEAFPIEQASVFPQYVEFAVYYRIVLYIVWYISGLNAVGIQNQLQIVHVNFSQRKVVINHLVTN